MAKYRMVVGVDGSTGAVAAVSWCAEMAGQFDAEVVAVSALPPLLELIPPASPPSAPIYYSDETRQELQRDLEARCEPFRVAGVPYRAMLAEGRAAEALIRVADDVDAAMIVVGRRGSGGFAELLLGSVPHHLSHHASRPVVVVPAG
jgi:nucleotide-binding universal stress UspA family protein